MVSRDRPITLQHWKFVELALVDGGDGGLRDWRLQTSVCGLVCIGNVRTSHVDFVGTT